MLIRIDGAIRDAVAFLDETLMILSQNTARPITIACLALFCLGCGDSHPTGSTQSGGSVQLGDGMQTPKPDTSSDGDDLNSRIDQLFRPMGNSNALERFSDDSSSPSGNSKIVNATPSESPPGGVAITAGGKTAGGKTAAADSPDVNRLMARLHELHRMQLDIQSMEQFHEIQNERIDNATKLLAAEPSYEFQILAIKSQIDAMSWLAGTRLPNAAEQLDKRCRELMASDTAEFRRMGMLGLTGAYMRAFSNDPQSSVEPLLEDIRTILRKNPDDFELATELAQASSTLFTTGHRDKAIQVMLTLREELRQSSEISVIGIADSLAAQVAMAEVRFDKIIAGQVEDEAANMPNLLTALDTIVASGTTVALYNEMIPWMRRFEEYACYRSADAVAAALETAFRKLPADAGTVEVLEALRPIRKRMGLVGKTLDWTELLDFKGQPFNADLLKNKVVLLTFFTAEADENQRNQLQFETRIFEELQNRGFAMVGFNVDNDSNAAKNFFRTRPPRWHCLRSANEAKLGFAAPFAERVVADQVPYRLLLDREGRVVHVAVPIERLGTYVTKLLQAEQ